MTAPPTISPPAPFRGRFLLDPIDRAPYATASGILAALPQAVAVPADRDDVAALVRWAGETRTALTPRAAGTGMPATVDRRGEAVGPPSLRCFERA